MATEQEEQEQQERIAMGLDPYTGARTGLTDETGLDNLPPPLPQPESEIEPEPETIPEVRIPEGAKPSRWDAEGNVIARALGGEIYYEKGSLPYELGHRTESDFAKAQGYTQQYVGIYPGSRVPEGSVIVFLNGEPTYRITRNEIEKEGINPETQFLGGYKFGVTDSEGKEVLITPKQYDKLASAETPEAQLKVAKSLKLVPKDTTLKEFTTTREEAWIKYKEADEVSEAEYKKQQASTTKLRDGRIANADLARINEEDIELYKVLVDKEKGGFKAAEEFEIRRQREIESKNVKLPPDKEGGEPTYIPDGQFKKIPEKYAHIGLTKGYDQMVKAIDEDEAKLAPYTSTYPGPTQGDKIGYSTFDAVKYLRDHPKDTETLKEQGYDAKDIKDWQRLSTSPIYLAGEYATSFEKHLKELGVPSGVNTVQLAAKNPGLLKKATTLTDKEFTKAELQAIDKEGQLQVAGGVLQIASLPVGGKAGISVFSAGMAVPTAGHWGYLSTSEKVVEVGQNVALTAAFLWGGKIAKGIEKLRIAPVERLATKAGNAGQNLEKATTNYAKTLTTADLKLNQVAIAERANVVEKAQRASMKADRQFLTKFDTLESLTPKQLTNLEARSGIKGLKDAVTGVKKSVDEVETAWKFVDKSKFYPNAKTPSQVEANNRHMLRLKELEGAQGRLQQALERADSTLKPRYSQTITSQPLLIDIKPVKLQSVREIIAEMKTARGAEYERLYRRAMFVAEGSSLGAASSDQMLLKALPKTNTLQSYQQIARIARESARLDKMFYGKRPERIMKPQPARIDTQRQGKLRQKQQVKAQLQQGKYAQQLPRGSEARPYTKAQQAILGKIQGAQNVPLTKSQLRVSDFPGVAPKVKLLVLPTPQFFPKRKMTFEEEREWLRSTPAQRARDYPQEELEDMRSQVITADLAKTDIFTKASPTEWQQVKDMVSAGVGAQQRAITSGATKAQIQSQVSNAIQQQAKENTKQQAQEQTKAQQQTQTKAQATQQVKQAVQQKAQEQTQTRTQTRTQTQAQVEAVTKAVVETPVKTKKPPPKEPPPKKPPKKGIKLPPLSMNASDKEKRDYIKALPGGATAINMGRLKIKGKLLDIWHVRTDDGKRIVVVGRVPEGATNLADGKGSASKTTQRLGGEKNFKPYTEQFGAVKARIRPSQQPKGAEVSFSSYKSGKIHITDMGVATAYSLKKIGPHRRRRAR